MKVSLIIPALNELVTLPALLKKVLALNLDLEIILVNDGSTDGTEKYILEHPHERLIAIHSATRSGKGVAVRRGIDRASGDVIGILDADLEYDPDDIPALVAPFHDGAQVVFGSRILKKDNGMSYRRYYLGGRFLTAFTNLLYRSRLTDEPTGYKFFRATTIRGLDLQCTGFEFCPEVTAKLLRIGIPIVEIPVSYRPRSFAQGKKIQWSDGIIAILTLVKYRFGRITWNGGLYAGSLS